MTPAGSAAIALEGASLQFDSITALDNISLEIPRGQKVALVGPSGAGKSSLLNTIAGRVDLTTGAAVVLSHDVSKLNGRHERAVRRRVGMISQGLDLALPLRVVHNVNAGKLGRWSTARSFWSLLRPPIRGAAAALAKVELEDRLLSRTDELSGGERQRVAIARVLVQQPDVILADEPTASVDPKLADLMFSLLCAGEHTLIASAHDPQLARRHVDRLIGMRDGRVVLDASSSAVSDAQLAQFYER